MSLKKSGSIIYLLKMSIILSSNVFQELIDHGKLNVVRKTQKLGGYNYFITPNMGIKLHHGKVIESNSNYIVLQFDKRNALTLMMMMKSINSKLLDYIEGSYALGTVVKYEMFQDKEDTFSVRCFLPHYKNKYHIETYLKGDKIPWVIPRKNSVLEQVYVDIRNLWHKNEKLGYNLEVKVIEF
jgi:hypothetical protein